MEVNIKVMGLYKILATRTVNGKKTTRIAADWFPNLITNLGLDKMANTVNWLAYCHVGSGNTTPQYTDTSLVALIAASNTRQVIEHGTDNTGTYYTWNRYTYRFAEGTAAGNLSEVGVGSADTGAVLFSRALILDELEAPTTITILSDETLDVVYEVRFYPKIIDSTGQVIFTGNIGGTYDWTMRSAGCGSTTYWRLYNATNSGVAMNNYHNAATPVYTVLDGAIGAITAFPSGDNSVVEKAVSTYVVGEYKLTHTLTAGLSAGNFAGGIKSFRFSTGCGNLQGEFTPTIPKTANDILSFNIEYSWGRV